MMVFIYSKVLKARFKLTKCREDVDQTYLLVIHALVCRVNHLSAILLLTNQSWFRLCTFD